MEKRRFLFYYFWIAGRREERGKREGGETGGWIFGFKFWLASYLISAHLSYSRPGGGRNGEGIVCECHFRSKREKRRKGRENKIIKKVISYISLIYEYLIQ